MTAGKPLKPEKYDLVNANGLDVYVYKDAEAEPAGITIFTKPDPYEINWLRVSGLIYAQTDLG